MIGRGLRTARRVANLVLPVLLAGALLLPAFRTEQLEGRTLELRTWVADWMRPLSLSQQWGMYAPDPMRSMGYMLLTAMHEDGRRVPLEESAQSRASWGTVWGWEKTRVDIWRYRLSTQRPERPNRQRAWFLRGICVREARRGRMPEYIQMEQISRRFTPPKAVRRGEPGLGPEVVKRSDRGWCASPLVAEMLALDLENNPELWAPEALAAAKAELDAKAKRKAKGGRP